MHDIQATILHEGGGRYRLVATQRGRAVKLNGHKLGDGGTLLESGNQIVVGGHEMVFVIGKPES